MSLTVFCAVGLSVQQGIISLLHTIFFDGVQVCPNPKYVLILVSYVQSGKAGLYVVVGCCAEFRVGGLHL